MDTNLVHYLPIATTIISALFCAVLVRRYRERGGLHLMWWGIGMFTYGLGTALESSITVFGNSAALTKAWYIAGALLGGYPLAQGSVYLHLKRKTANVLTAVTIPLLVVVSAVIVASPVLVEHLEPHRPTGAVLGWQWVRLTTPFINLYSFVFLVGGALYSAYRYARSPDTAAGNRAVGNALIAFGAVLPGIGGSMAKAGFVEALYVGEFVGILMIFAGYRACVMPATTVQGSPSHAVTSQRGA